MNWKQLSFQVKKQQADLVSEVLIGLGSISITYKDAYDEAIYEPPVGQTPLWDDVEINALFSSDINQESIKDSIFEICNIKVLTSSHLKDRAWEEEFKKDFQPMKFGKRLWVFPSWESQIKLPNDSIIVNMDPGLAFGTGTHQTTSLCLNYLDANPPKDKRVIDFGCGTGILAIAAAKLGASSLLAIDNDPQAVIACKENVINNHCEGLIKTIHSNNLVIKEKCDLLIANILTNPLIELAPLFASSVNPNGVLLLSGILKQQVDKVLDCYKEYFFDIEVANIDEWNRITGKRKL
ncbi:50S ribosomal protein L11 methyltransferase [Candidatus Thioglobus sp. NP1]|uniref:50S ribosomal protein L11 methyltransferase n=1 Tax=Candidatus Thioglobus sp. NP1 TaxID=2508687 RepID=UPI000DEDAA16|nr:50S ribosomal protein L11 methyltransferase [Candidatus Thioglobus sp. NP1]AXE61743.1 50S ribosomal protein L11 methyltransferase [Candidatus Thioglobus sp. NP1]